MRRSLIDGGATARSRQASPGTRAGGERGDAVTALAREAAREEHINHTEAADMLGVIMTPGNETTANLIGNGLWALMRHPGQMERLREEPERERAASGLEEAHQHVTDVVLAAKEHGQHADRLTRLVDVEPVDRPIDGQMPQAGQDVVMAFGPMGRRQDALRGDTNLPDPRTRVLERALKALADVEVAPQEMVEYQPEIAFGRGRELKTKAHAHGACRQSSVQAEWPSRLR